MMPDDDYLDDARDQARLMADDDKPPTQRVNDKGWIYIKIMPDDEPDSEPGICPACNGSGEGMHEGTRCVTCKGAGEC